MPSRRTVSGIVMLAFVVACASLSLRAQTTAFTYQGKINDGATVASGSYDFQFALFDQLAGGTQQPQPGPVTLTQSNVIVTSGIFTVTLDFGVAALTGADRFLDISIKRSTDSTFQLLTPRQLLTSSPYSVRTLSAGAADNVPFSGVTSGATSSTLHIGNGGSLDATGSGSITATNVTGTVAIANGGTGSNTKNFVDLSTAQTVAGAKTFSSSSNSFTGSGSGLTLGQLGATVFGSTQLTLGSAVFTQVPGLTQTVNMPAGQIAYIVTSGGVSTNSVAANGVSVVDVEIQIDGTDTAGSFRRIDAANTAGLTNAIQYWAIAQTAALTPGAHTITVVARLVAGSQASVSGDSSSVLQGSLVVTTIKQ